MNPEIVREPVLNGNQAVLTEDCSPNLEAYRAIVGPVESYDVGSAYQFNLLTTLGLRENHSLLDIGCGCLRGGRLFIPYLKPDRYFGIEPLKWLVQEGIDNEVGESAMLSKRPVISDDSNYTLTTFGQEFDFLLAQSIFSHESQTQICRCLAQARKVMKPSSIFVATFFEGLKNYSGDDWVIYAEYTMERMREMVEAQGLICQPIEWSHQDPQRWILILHPETTYKPFSSSESNSIMHLEDQLLKTRQLLMTMRNHPYVRFGRKLNYCTKWLGLAMFRLKHKAHGFKAS